MFDISFILHDLLLPLGRVAMFMCLGLLAATVMEVMHWTRFAAKLAAPLAGKGHLGEVAAASFSVAFFSPSAANALLAENYDKGVISRRELIFANLFNSSPSYLVHLPSLCALLYAFLGLHAFIYVGLTFTAATLRTLGTMLAGRMLLPPPGEGRQKTAGSEEARMPGQSLAKALKRLRKRLLILLLFTVPVYCIVYAMQKAGWFSAAESFIAQNAGSLLFVQPEYLGIVALYMLADSSMALSAAAPLLNSGALQYEQAIMALLIGNILSSPMRAFRHQLPSYAGYFKPGLAIRIIAINQLCRAVSLVIVSAAYFLFFIDK